MNAQRPMRADARRNYENLLAKAADVIEESGTDASLEEVARRAGVGIGTLYRHFPTRDALLEALLRERFDAMSAQAEELLEHPDADAAMVTWLRALATQSSTYRGLTALLVSALRDEGSALYASCHAMRAAGERLLARAKKDGAVRPDVEASEAFTLAYSLAFTLEHDENGAARLDRMLSLVMDGLRVR